MKLRLASFLALCVACAGCGGGENGVCGPGDPATHEGISGTFTHPLSSEEVNIAWEGFTSGANNDCPSTNGGATSLSIFGYQQNSGFVITFCVPSPDEIGNDPVALVDESPEHSGPVEVVDVTAQLDDGCVLEKDVEVPPAGTITFSGLCADGTDPAGYAITIDAEIGGIVTCPRDTIEPVTVTLAGSAVVTAQ